MKLILATTLLCAISLSEAKLSVGDCPNYQNVADFDINKYLGRWYDIQHFYNDYEGQDSCIASDYGYISSDKMSMEQTFLNAKGVGHLNAVATLTGVVPGQFIYTYKNVMPDYFNVIGVDYDKYSVTYACRQEGYLKDEYGWVQFRTYEIDNDLLEEALAVYTSNGIDYSGKLDIPYQGSECPYNLNL